MVPLRRTVKVVCEKAAPSEGLIRRRAAFESRLPIGATRSWSTQPSRCLSQAASAARAASAADTAWPDYVLNCPETRVTTLDNGLRVASETNHGATASVGVWIDTGSRYENADNNGAAHFLEHMFFKGTSRRTQTQLETEIENMGAHVNAYTSREQTVYYAKVFKEDVGRGLDILSDIVMKSRMDDGAIRRERDVILREMEEINKQQEEVILDHMHEVAFKDCGLGRTILGPEKNIRNMTRGHLQEYITTHYTGPRIVVCGAGALEHEHLVAVAHETFGNVPREPPSGFEVKPDPGKYTGGEKRVLTNKEKDVHLAIAFEGTSWMDENAFTLMVMHALLGTWDRVMGANVVPQLGQALGSSPRDICNWYMSFNTCYKDTGLFGIYAIAPPDHLPELTDTMMGQLMQLCHSVRDEDVERAKMQVKTNMLMQLDSFAAKIEEIGRQMLTYGRRMPSAEVFARIDAIDTEDVRICANRIFNDEDHAMAVIGPAGGLPAYEHIRSRSIAQL